MTINQQKYDGSTIVTSDIIQFVQRNHHLQTDVFKYDDTLLINVKMNNEVFF